MMSINNDNTKDETLATTMSVTEVSALLPGMAGGAWAAAATDSGAVISVEPGGVGGCA